jgi:hypothetical protein
MILPTTHMNKFLSVAPHTPCLGYPGFSLVRIRRCTCNCLFPVVLLTYL